MNYKVEVNGKTYHFNWSKKRKPTDEESKAIVQDMIEKEHSPSRILGDFGDKFKKAGLDTFEDAKRIGGYLLDSPEFVKEGAGKLKESIEYEPRGGGAAQQAYDRVEGARRDFGKEAIDFMAPSRLDLMTMGLAAAAKPAFKAAPKIAEKAIEVGKFFNPASELGKEAGVLKIGAREAGTNPRSLGTNPRAVKEAEQHLDSIRNLFSQGDDVETVAQKLNLKPATVQSVARKHNLAEADIENAVNEVLGGNKTVVQGLDQKTVDALPEDLSSGVEFQSTPPSGNLPPGKAGPPRFNPPRNPPPPSPPGEPPDFSSFHGKSPEAITNRPFHPRDLLDVFGPLQRSLQSSLDLSAPLRQSLIPTILHPSSSGPAFKNMFRALRNPEVDIVGEIARRPNANVEMFTEEGDKIARNLYKEAGLGINDPSDVFPSQLAHHIPIANQITRRGEATFGAYADTIRANEFDRLLSKGGFSPEHPPGPEEARDIAHAINTLTGYGEGGEIFENMVPGLQFPLYSPRLNKARFDVLSPASYLPIPTSPGRYNTELGRRTWNTKFGPTGRKILASNVGAAGALGGGALAGLDMLGEDPFVGEPTTNLPLDIDFSPTESDFLKVKMGDTRISPASGYDSMLRLGARLGDYGINDDSKIDPGFEIEKFGRSKLAPGLTSFASDMWFGKGKNVVGEPIKDMKYFGQDFDTPYLGYAARQHTPLFAQEVGDILQSDDPENLAIAGPLGAFGMGSMTYKKKEKKPKGQKDPYESVDRLYKKIYGK